MGNYNKWNRDEVDIVVCETRIRDNREFEKSSSVNMLHICIGPPVHAPNRSGLNISGD